jgi:hypothetical protein
MVAVRTAVVAEMADVRGLSVLIRCPAAHAVLRIGCVLECWAGDPRIVERRRRIARAPRPDPTRGSSPFTTSTVSIGRCATCAAPALSTTSSRLAVPVELVAEEVPEADRPWPDALQDLPAGRLRPPRAGRARRPRPRGGWTPRRRRDSRPVVVRQPKRGRGISAAMAVVVVLPFVAETAATPAGSRAASRSIAPGSSFDSSLPGTVMPAPAPSRRERPATSRAARISAAVSTGRGYATIGVPRSRGSRRT